MLKRVRDLSAATTVASQLCVPTGLRSALYEMRGRIDQIDTLRRPNLMARYVEYMD